MALQKSIESPSGVEAAYHKIIHFSLDQRNEMMDVVVGCYKDSDARQADKSPLMVKSYKLDASSLNHSQAMFPQVYNLIKQEPEFENSQDV